MASDKDHPEHLDKPDHDKLGQDEKEDKKKGRKWQKVDGIDFPKAISMKSTIYKISGDGKLTISERVLPTIVLKQHVNAKKMQHKKGD